MGGVPVCFYWKPLQGFAWRPGPLRKGVSRLEGAPGLSPPMPPPIVGATREQESPPHFPPLSLGSVGLGVISLPFGPCSPAWAGICTHFTDAQTKGQELNHLARDHQLESLSELRYGYRPPSPTSIISLNPPNPF